MENNLRGALVNCLKQQLSEFELLKSMYPCDEDIILSDKTVLQEIEKSIFVTSEYTPNHLDFVLNLTVDNFKLELYVNLPNFYPQDEPDLLLRCNQLNRQQESNLNKELSQYIKDNHSDEVCLYNAVCWLQDNIHRFKEGINTSEIKVDNVKKDEKFARIWIYSHHIYNKKKREVIVSLAKDLQLTGFCLPGKPGIICVEGPESMCLEWWKHIKSMSWKKITIRKKEEFDISEQVINQKFFNFEELQFPNASFQKHADLGQFSKYLHEHDLTQSFNDFFGLCSDNG